MTRPLFHPPRDTPRPGYLPTLTALLCRPRAFFSPSRLADQQSRALGYLMVSAGFSALAAALGAAAAGPLPVGAIHLANALGMTVISAGLGHMVLVMSVGRRVRFSAFFSVYALAAGTTLVFSWVPFSFWFTEPWKWWLTFTGLVDGLGLSRRLSLAIIGITVIVLTLFFYSLLPLLAPTG